MKKNDRIWELDALRGVCSLCVIAVHLIYDLGFFIGLDLHLPAWAGDTPPNQLGDAASMHRADLLYWAAALAVSIAAYYGIEKPAARRFSKSPEKMCAQKAR